VRLAVRVDLEKTTEIAQSLRVTGGVLIGVAVFALLVAIVGLTGTLLMVLGHTDHSIAVQLAAGACLLCVGVALPGAGGMAAAVFSIRSFRRAHAYETLATSLLLDGTLDRTTFEARLGRDRSERLISDAVARGALSTLPGEPTLAPSGPPSPRVVIPESAYTPRLAEQTLGMAATSLATPSVRPPPMPLDDRPSPAARPEHPETRTPGAPLMRHAPEPTGFDLTGRRYALKTMLPSAQLSESAIARFEREARAATAIGHTGIAAVHDFDVTSEGLHYLVMDLLVGESLEARLARVGRLPWPEAKRVALEIADALAAAHRAGVLHRDVKPSNVFMASREGAAERAMLVDFGLAKPIVPSHGQAVTRTGAIVGTAHYMSPEQARSEAVDERTDVYGLGATLYEMLAGVPPFLGASPFAVMAMLLQEQPVAPSSLATNVPAAVDALVLRALAKAPNDRWPSVPAIQAALESTP